MNKSIGQIKAEFEAAEEETLPLLFAEYADDARSGVQNLLVRYRKKLEKLSAERERLRQMRQFENAYGQFDYICGIDEVGRGPLAGPVVAGAVILPKDCDILWINDSKKLSAGKREELYTEIQEKAVAVGIGVVSPERIDEINILQATYEAMRRAVQKLKVAPQILLNDAVTIPQISVPQVPIVKGDTKSMSIAAASIVAKVTRDHMMEKYDSVYPGYKFAQNKGYGSGEHIEALKRLGPSPIHRRSFIGHFAADI
ncbi:MULTISPECIES: ribonuclease HII [Mediterraneibacter]|jgi:ribonuclease HII|uniref:ribonuclease HII n=1 Tax=Mediterraneibacter TaxID=2316020 RepID=UPI0022E7EC2A|nr:ribonuclease HII [Mediterraneibacter massiliensis]